MDSDLVSIEHWFEALARAVEATDYDAAIALCAPDFTQYGANQATLMIGAEATRDHQWTTAWPYVTRCRYDTAGMVTHLSRDRCLAVVAIDLYSSGKTIEEMPARATVAFTRLTPDREWLAVHAHYSMAASPTAR